MSVFLKLAPTCLALTSLVFQTSALAGEASDWKVDFFDDFDTFNEENWQDQRIWVNNEDHCYVPDGQCRGLKNKRGQGQASRG